MVKLGGFLLLVGALFLLNGLVQVAKFRGSEDRWKRSPALRSQLDDPRGPPAWMIEQRIWLRFGHLSLRLGPPLITAGLVLILVGVLVG